MSKYNKIKIFRKQLIDFIETFFYVVQQYINILNTIAEDKFIFFYLILYMSLQ